VDLSDGERSDISGYVEVSGLLGFGELIDMIPHFVFGCLTKEHRFGSTLA